MQEFFETTHISLFEYNCHGLLIIIGLNHLICIHQILYVKNIDAIYSNVANDTELLTKARTKGSKLVM